MVCNENDNSDSYDYEYILFIGMYYTYYSFALSVKGVKCTTTITWLNDKILLRDVYRRKEWIVERIKLNK